MSTRKIIIFILVAGCHPDGERSEPERPKKKYDLL
jgi:hypothetical protein